MMIASQQQVISKAIEKYDLYHADALTVLATVEDWILQG